MRRYRHKGRDQTSIWAGFVDVQSGLLLIFIFVLLIFVVTQNLLSVQLTDSNTQITQIMQNVDSLKNKLNSTEQKLENSKKKLDDTQYQLTQKQKQLNHYTAQIDEATTTIRILSHEVTQKEQVLAQLQTQLEESQDKLAQREADIEAANILLNESLDELSKSQDSLVQTQKLLTKNSKVLYETQTELTETRTNLREANTHIGTLSNDKLALIENIADVERRLHISLQNIDNLKASIVEKDKQLNTQNTVLDQQKILSTSLKNDKIELSADKARLEAELAVAYQSISATEMRVSALLTDIEILRKMRDKFQSDVHAQNQTLENARLRESELTQEVQNQRILAEDAEAKVNLVNQQLADLRSRVQSLQEALKVSKSSQEAGEVKINNLEQELNLALAEKVQALSLVQSNYLSNMRSILEKEEDFILQGDRFILQSEVLFNSGTDTIGIEGRKEIKELTELLLRVTKQIPENFDWALRVDGHTDTQPLARNARFKDNWHLSTARARAIVRLMIGYGFPEQNIMATGFGETRPINNENTSEAYRLNRRIEFKLTQP